MTPPSTTENRQAFPTVLLGSTEVARATRAYVFEKPRGFRFTAGQCTVLRLPEGHGLEGEDREHVYSITSAPSDEAVVIATRTRDSPFKRVLAGLEQGAEVELDPPDGEFVLPEGAKRPVAGIAGGIGITPFRSMLREAAHTPRREGGPAMTLLYSNADRAEAAFLEELRDLEAKVEGFRLVPTMTQDPEWDGETGRVDAAMLERHVPGLARAGCYVAGPPRMVKDMVAMLRAAGVAKDNVNAEVFTGY